MCATQIDDVLKLLLVENPTQSTLKEARSLVSEIIRDKRYCI